MKKHAFFFLFLLIATTAISQEKGIDYKLYNKARGAQQRGEYQRAVILYNSFISSYPEEFPQAYLERGLSYFRMQQYEAAIQNFQQASNHTLTSKEGTYWLGKTYSNTQNYTAAIQQLSRHLKLAPNHAIAYNDRGMAHFHQHHFDLALNDFDKANQLDSTLATVCNNAGAARYYNQNIAKPHRKDLLQARDWFTKSIQQDSTFGLAYRNRASMFIFLKDYPSAQQDLKAASHFSPNDPMVFFYKGVTLAGLDRRSAALDALQEALKMDSQLLFAYEEIGNLYKKQGQYEKAIQYYELAKKARQKIGHLYLGLMDYRIALVRAEQENPTALQAALKLAKKQGVFRDRLVYQDFLKAKELKKYRRERFLQRFTRSIRKGKKDNKFIQPELGWFRMR